MKRSSVKCAGCGATFRAVALDLLGVRMEAWLAGWEYDAWADGTSLDLCAGCCEADSPAVAA